MTAILSTKQFNTLAEALVSAEPDAVTGKITVDQIKTILVEIGDLVPASIADLDDDD